MPPNKARMSTTNDINWWQQKAEELRLQVHLGRKEAAEAYEQQKKEMGSWAADLRYKLERLDSEGSQRLRQKLEELELQAALGKAEGKEALEAEQRKLANALWELKADVVRFLQKGTSEVTEITEKAEDTLEHWHTRLDMMRVQMHLGAKEASEELERFRKNANEKINEIRSRIEKAHNEGQSEWNKLKKDLEGSWKDFKGLFE